MKSFLMHEHIYHWMKLYIMGFNSRTFMLFSKIFWIFWNLFVGAYFLIYLWTLISMNLFRALLMHPSKCRNLNKIRSSVWCAALGNYLDFQITIISSFFLLICIWKNCGVLKISKKIQVNSLQINYLLIDTTCPWGS